MFFPYRDDNPRRTFPYVTVTLIVTNVLLQLYQLGMSHPRLNLFIRAGGVIPLEIVTMHDIVRFPDQPRALVPIPLTLLTAMFLHGGWLHLISNMWYLWIFGDNVEDQLGHFRFLMFYLLVGVLSFVAQILMTPTSLVPTVGASGAIAGILGAYIAWFPTARIHCLAVLVIFITTIRIPAFFVLGFWFVLQLLNGAAANPAAGGVAWFAHVGGFVAGLVLVRVGFQPRQNSH